MASMFQSLLERTVKLPTTLLQLLSRSASASSSSSSASAACYQIEGELKKLRRRMERIRAILVDAEGRETREESVKVWLDELRDVACDSEDVLDEVEYELLRYQLECEEEEAHSPNSHDETGIMGKHEVGGSSATPARCTPLHDASFQQQIVDEIKRINDLFDEIYRDGLALKLHEEDGRRHGADLLEPPMRMPTSCFVDEQEVHGRDDDKGKVIGMLLPDDDDDDDHSHYKENVRAVSIVGMGGLGKTTLAQLVYNDDQVVNHFEKRLWVCVSDNFDVAQLTKQILEALEDGSHEVQEYINFSCLQQSLQRKLQGKRFLLVLDDVWNESQKHWEALWVSLTMGAEGSRVLITTRSEMVSRICRANPESMHRLGCLPEDDCWSLFEQRAFGGRGSGDHPELVQIGRKIVGRCKGVPLTVKTLAGLLFCEFRQDRWTDILRSELWELPEGNGDILPALRLSYHHLPSPLKPCFAYCAVFPKDHVFGGEQLLWMWIAHGYIRPPARRCMEDLGRRYSEDLLQRSFFQDSSPYFPGRRQFVMHDLIHDLASSVRSGERCQVVHGRLSSDRARHLVFTCWEDIARLLSHGSVYNLKRCRTALLLGRQDAWHAGDSGTAPFLKALNDMLSRMRNLRVLDLGSVEIHELPDSVDNLKHLRYLRFGGWYLTGLPESLGDLLNLQILEIAGQLRVKEFPKRLKDLVSLRHLCFSSRTISKMPCGIRRLTQLRTLPLFVVGEGTGAAGIEELATLNDLQGQLNIVVRSLNNWVDKGTRSNILNDKRALQSVALWFGDNADSNFCYKSPYWTSMQRQREQKLLLESLQPHAHIKEMRVSGYGSGRFPKWMGQPSYKRLERIHLKNCWNCRRLPALGQLPSLKTLEVCSMGAVTSAGGGFSEATSFPSLEKLVLQGLWKYKGNLCIGSEAGGAFRRLSYLEIRQCPKLKCVKLRRLAALRELNVHRCQQLAELDWLHQQQVPTDDDHMHIPGIQIMVLLYCPRLSFLSALQQLPLTLWRLDVSRSPLLSEWVRNRIYELTRITCVRADQWLRRILSLHNVQDVHEPRAWEYIPFTSRAQVLELVWDDAGPQGFNPSHAAAEQLLDVLHPPDKLEELLMRGYRGRSFPAWVGDPGRLSHLVKMTLCGFVHCDCLPPLGRLPSLRQLCISWMLEVRCVGREFCPGGGGGGSFPSLLALDFCHMPQWEEWQVVEDDTFPVLEVLRIRCCPNLRNLKLPAPLLSRQETLPWGSDVLEQEPEDANHLELRFWPVQFE